jgi:signal transduction histidine kinase/DNA-binding response OmpR family regulator
MKLKDFKIRFQLQWSFILILFFVILLGTISYRMNNQLHEQTETMHSHPLKVQLAIGLLRSDIFAMSSEMKDCLLETDKNRIDFDLNQIQTYKADAFERIDVLYTAYLGPIEDVDSVKYALIKWNLMQEETSRLLLEGKAVEAVMRNTDFGVEESQERILLSNIEKIISFSKNKAETLYTNSVELTQELNRQLIVLVIAILLLTIILNYFLLRNITNPINELTLATKRFHDGDLSSRSSYAVKNEFGTLSASFNVLAQSIQLKTDLDEKFAGLTELMLSEYDAKKFFKSTLTSLSSYTNSQMAAVYLLSENKKTFEHFDSFGFDENARQSFAADISEGEFGSALSSRKVHHLKNISEKTRFIFNTTGGRFIPNEILTLPIITGDEVIALISLATVSVYKKEELQLIDDVFVTLCARIEGILVYHKNKEFSSRLEAQNRELESQKMELSAQSSELREQNTELEMQKNQLNEVSRLKTNFLSNMSHELRTPLNSVIALSGVLNRRLSDRIPEEEYSYLAVIERNGKHLLELINDILDISRIEAGKEEVEITSFDAGELITEVVSMIQPQASQKNIQLLYSPEGSEHIIMSDPDKCSHILQNLVSNAVKFTEEGKVEIVVQQDDDTISISVADTGIGISEKHLPYIFDEFRQADGSTSRRFGGTGLGLAIAKKYSSLLGGTIAVNSTLEKGSVFTLVLPLKYKGEIRETEKETIDAIKPIAEPVLKNRFSGLSLKTILLVEDNEPAIIQIKDFLEESGYRILIARDGMEALKIIADTVPDAMILDLMMPGIDGFEVLKTIRNEESTAHIPVLILTAKHISKDDLKLLKRNNIHQLIQKGAVSKIELLDSLTNMIFPKVSKPVETVRQKFQAKGAGEKPVILVVEDNSDNMLTVKALLDKDFTILEAVDGDSCLTVTRKHKPDLVLMDIALPGMDGIEAFKIIRNDPRLQHIPIIALTASAMTSDREIILSHGFDAYIAKPIEERIFFKTINTILYE